MSLTPKPIQIDWHPIDCVVAEGGNTSKRIRDKLWVVFAIDLKSKTITGQAQLCLNNSYSSRSLLSEVFGGKDL